MPMAIRCRCGCMLNGECQGPLRPRSLWAILGPPAVFVGVLITLAAAILLA